MFLGSAELASAIASRLGKLPTRRIPQEMGVIDADKASVYRYMNFNEIAGYAEVAARSNLSTWMAC